MKLLRFGQPGRERPGIIDEKGRIRDLSDIISDITGDTFERENIKKLNSINLNDFPLVDKNTRIGPCISGVGKFICIGLNYSDHAAESGMDVPKEPIIFFKATSAICGPNDNIELPHGSEATDWEVELGVIIRKHGKYVSMKDSMDHIGGYCVINDISERDFQLKRSGQWVKGKSADTFGPIGPWLVTPDEIEDPQDLSLYLDVNNKKYQNGSTKTMVFGVSHLISYISQFMSLQPGDIISTGTPPGVGMGQKPNPIYLKRGDKMELGVEGLGKQSQTVI